MLSRCPWRRRQGVEPTAAGRAALGHCRALLGRIDQLCADAIGFGEGLRGLIRIAANESAAIGYLPGDISAFLEDCPEVKIDLQVETSPMVVRKVQENACDIGIFTGDDSTGDLTVLPYRQDRLVAIVSSGHPIAAAGAAGAVLSFARVLNHPLVGSEAAGAIEATTLRAAAELGRKPDTRIRVSSYDAAARLVEAGAGVSIMTEAVARPLARALDIVVVGLAEPTWANRELRICLRRGADREAPVVARFLSTLARGPVDRPAKVENCANPEGDEGG